MNITKGVKKKKQFSVCRMWEQGRGWLALEQCVVSLLLMLLPFICCSIKISLRHRLRLIVERCSFFNSNLFSLISSKCLIHSSITCPLKPSKLIFFVMGRNNCGDGPSCWTKKLIKEPILISLLICFQFSQLTPLIDHNKYLDLYFTLKNAHFF